MRACRVPRLVLLTALAACSSEPPPVSHANDIATPGNIDVGNLMAWYDSEVIVIGECPAGQPVVRANCQGTIRGRKAYLDVVNEVDASFTRDIATQNAAHDAEIAQLRNADPVVQSLREQIAQLTTDIDTLTSTSSDLAATLSSLNTQLSTQNLAITQTEQQLSEVNRPQPPALGDTNHLSEPSALAVLFNTRA
jgi:hypothetical protein